MIFSQQFMMLYLCKKYKYQLRNGSESKAKYEIDIQNWSHFNSIFDINRRIITLLLPALLFTASYYSYQRPNH